MLVDAGTLDIEIHQGNTLSPVIDFGFSLAGARVRQQVRSNAGSDVKLDADSNDGTITTSGSIATWQNIPVTFSVGVYKHDILVVTPDGQEHTYLEGKFEVLPAITKSE